MAASHRTIHDNRKRTLESMPEEEFHAGMLNGGLKGDVFVALSLLHLNVGLGCVHSLILYTTKP